MVTSVIIPAAGAGERMGAAVSKQFLLLQGKPIIVHTLERFQRCAAVDEIIVAVQASSRQHLESLLGKFHLSKTTKIVEGGKRRQDSVGNALSQVNPQAEVVIVHDAVRPFIQQKMILESIEKAITYSAAVVAVRVKDTTFGSLDDRLGEVPSDRPVIVVCRSGGRSYEVARTLATRGYVSMNLAGGMYAWHDEGLPVVRDDGSPGVIA